MLVLTGGGPSCSLHGAACLVTHASANCGAHPPLQRLLAVQLNKHTHAAAFHRRPGQALGGRRVGAQCGAHSLRPGTPVARPLAQTSKQLAATQSSRPSSLPGLPPPPGGGTKGTGMPPGCIIIICGGMPGPGCTMKAPGGMPPGPGIIIIICSTASTGGSGGLLSLPPPRGRSSSVPHALILPCTRPSLHQTMSAAPAPPSYNAPQATSGSTALSTRIRPHLRPAAWRGAHAGGRHARHYGVGHRARRHLQRSARSRLNLASGHPPVLRRG